MGGNPSRRQIGGCLPEDSGIYHHILRGGHPKGGIIDTDCVDSDVSLEVSDILLSEDVRHSYPTCDLSATDLLCARVSAVDNI